MEPDLDMWVRLGVIGAFAFFARALVQDLLKFLSKARDGKGASLTKEDVGDLVKYQCSWQGVDVVEIRDLLRDIERNTRIGG